MGRRTALISAVPAMGTLRGGVRPPIWEASLRHKRLGFSYHSGIV